MTPAVIQSGRLGGSSNVGLLSSSLQVAVLYIVDNSFPKNNNVAFAQAGEKAQCG